jgi:hypothetical protein
MIFKNENPLETNQFIKTEKINWENFRREPKRKLETVQNSNMHCVFGTQHTACKFQILKRAAT